MPDLVKAFAQIFGFLIASAFVASMVRFVFYFGSFVRRQDELGTKIDEATRTFNDFAKSIRETLEQHGKDILEIQVEARVRAELDKDRGRNRRDQTPPADMR